MEDLWTHTEQTDTRHLLEEEADRLDAVGNRLERYLGRGGASSSSPERQAFLSAISQARHTARQLRNLRLFVRDRS